jgi:phosphoglucomutase
MQLDNQTQSTIQAWLEGNYDVATKAEIQTLLDQGAYTELTDAFYRSLEFGTGGLRGIMGVGSNRINKYTIGTATQGLANYLNKKYKGQEISVAIAHDSRNNSDVFANIVADVFSANAIKVYFFSALRPTPELSFAIRELNCKSGVMLTASHNPKEYNGYKAYGVDGGQFTSPDDKMVMDEVAAIKSIDEVNFQRNEANIELIGENIDQLYLDKITALSVSPDAIARQKDLKIVYSPIHGTGITLVPKALAQFGFTNVTIVEEQSKPDGNFPTVIYPNPEEKEALSLALNKAIEIDADLVLATDPDADRVGIAVKNDEGDFVLLNGNQTGSLLVNYMLSAWQEKGKLTGKEYVVSTVVTTSLIKAICEEKGVEYFETLTGFKWIGQVMTELLGKKQFIVGGEESYGYLVGDLVRDKDAVISCAFIAEMTAFYKDKGSSLFEAMIGMYQQYGMYKEDLVAITKKGKSGAEEIKAMMQQFRNNPPATLGGSPVVQLKDYELNKVTDIATGVSSSLGFPKSDVLQFITADGSIISARPSGTEPKIKFYCSVNEPLANKEDFKATEQKLNEKIKTIMNDLQA